MCPPDYILYCVWKPKNQLKISFLQWVCGVCVNLGVLARLVLLPQVWNHFDTMGECVGQAIGVKVRLDNGIQGFIHLKNLSDKEVTNPEERVKINMPIHARITKIDIDRFSVDLTSKTSDLMDEDGKWKWVKYWLLSKEFWSRVIRNKSWLIRNIRFWLIHLNEW